MFIKTRKFINYSGSLKINVKKLRHNMTAAEKKLWYEFLRGYKYRFIRQKVIGNYILDFYCQKLKLGIEIDGETHLNDKNEIYDERRSEGLSKFGIKILRFWNDDIFFGLSEVENIIEIEIKKRQNPLNPPLKGG